MSISLRTALIIANNYPDNILIQANDRPDSNGKYNVFCYLLNEDKTIKRFLLSGGYGVLNKRLAEEELELLCEYFKKEYK